jgi:hypothetical protein
VSTTITGRTSDAIHLTYSEDTYRVGRLGQYFTSINQAWSLVLKLARYRAEGPLDEPLTYEPPTSHTPPAWVRLRVGGMSHEEDSPLPRLKFERIKLNSPLDITLALEAVGSTGVTVYAMYLLSTVLRDPERIGGLVASTGCGLAQGALGSKASPAGGSTRRGIGDGRGLGSGARTSSGSGGTDRCPNVRKRDQAR